MTDSTIFPTGHTALYIQRFLRAIEVASRYAFITLMKVRVMRTTYQRAKFQTQEIRRIPIIFGPTGQKQVRILFQISTDEVRSNTLAENARIQENKMITANRPSNITMKTLYWSAISRSALASETTARVPPQSGHGLPVANPNGHKPSSGSGGAKSIVPRRTRREDDPLSRSRFVWRSR